MLNNSVTHIARHPKWCINGAICICFQKGGLPILIKCIFRISFLSRVEYTPNVMVVKRRTGGRSSCGIVTLLRCSTTKTPSPGLLFWGGNWRSQRSHLEPFSPKLPAIPKIILLGCGKTSSGAVGAEKSICVTCGRPLGVKLLRLRYQSWSGARRLGRGQVVGIEWGIVLSSSVACGWACKVSSNRSNILVWIGYSVI